jgi:hypothetical protein
MTLGFVQAARRANSVGGVLRFSSQVVGLRDFIYTGLEEYGEPVAYIGEHFEGKDGRLPSIQVGKLSDVELEKLQRKKEKDDRKSRF